MVRKSTDNDLNIKILIACHKPSVIPHNDIFLPIQVGAAISNKDLGIQRDNSGDNISALNQSYCELTAIYWAWKNLDADYYGLWHYRRYMSFNDDINIPINPWGEYEMSANDNEALKMLHLSNGTQMSKLVKEYDLLVPNKGGAGTDETTYGHYVSRHYKKDLDFCLDYIKKTYPDIGEYIEPTLNDKYGYLRNMFIMKRAIFTKYCEFIFDVLSEFDKSVDISMYDPVQYRVDGYIAERLTNIYINYLINSKGVRYKELKSIYFHDTDPTEELPLIKKKNCVPIVFAVDNNYVPYTSVILHSIANHTSDNHFYDIIIFNKDITSDNKKRLQHEFIDRNNMSIRFYNVGKRLNIYKNASIRGHWSIETYFRLFIHEVMINYNKVLYLDADMLVMDDLAKLYNTEIGDYLIAAAKDPDSAGLYNGGHPSAGTYLINSKRNWKKHHYIDEVLKLDDPYNYFQAGVLLMNLEEMRKQLNSNDLAELATSKKWELQDQDILNVVCASKVKFIDLSWNVEYDWKHKRIDNVIKLAPKPLYDDYIRARSNPKIIHYAAPDKPWIDPECDFGIDWWNAARQSIYYDIILCRTARLFSWQAANNATDNIRLINRIRRFSGCTLRKLAPVGTRRRKFLSKAKNIIRHQQA